MRSFYPNRAASLVFRCTEGYFSGVQRRGPQADHSPPSIPEVQNEWPCTWRIQGQIYLDVASAYFNYDRCNSPLKFPEKFIFFDSKTVYTPKVAFRNFGPDIILNSFVVSLDPST